MSESIVKIHRAKDNTVTFSDQHDHTITLTPAALSYLEAKTTQQEQCIGVRIGLEEKGCSGLAYTVDYVQQTSDNDTVFTADKAAIHLFVANKEFNDKLNILHVVSKTKIDYVQQDLNKKLVFTNAAAGDSCGCGESFTLSDG